MKPAQLIVSPRDVLQAPSAGMDRQRVRDRAVDELYFRDEIDVRLGASFANITVNTASFAFPVMDMAAGAASTFRLPNRLRDLWPRTLLRLHLWYTSNVGSTNNFSVSFNLRGVGAGISLGGTTQFIASGTVSIPGPAVANDVLYTTLLAVGSAPASPALVTTNFSRLAPDANANALRVVWGEFEFQEVA